ncbi:MAG: aminodeoxychorismate synthase component I [Bacteroidota bacterium]|nr:aminodeoxychorismate synthase component I [Bacteroidota bacterium]MDP4232240.1 aminodeoxychorismate synthase component I [Bacteroidota bacterium]MDP4243581.1 aminodeoxychorismate synthase component I [Bacteroidota bacterium]MDP4289116.1 aminodeoxychorismate synthase component I [Bacteroidota bacterium]
MTFSGGLAKWLVPQAEVFARMNEWGRESMPFLFVIDYAIRQPLLIPLSEVKPEAVLFKIPNRTNANETSDHAPTLGFSKLPESFSVYQQKFARAMAHIQRGDTYLLNLTCRTPVALESNLRSIFHDVNAEYKILLEDSILVFSPECFVKIKDQRIASCPMKGTIDAALPNAENRILTDPKETAEHYTIVDLIRNDLSQIASSVEVDSFRHITRIETNQKTLLQVSSTISGALAGDWPARLGDIFQALLPAGSVTGAPKQKTCEIIDEIEGYDRGYYSGIFGVFDGNEVDSAVMIRFIEKYDAGFVFKSGGGITMYSDADAEYQEMIDKVYVPLV